MVASKPGGQGTVRQASEATTMCHPTDSRREGGETHWVGAWMDGMVRVYTHIYTCRHV